MAGANSTALGPGADVPKVVTIAPAIMAAPDPALTNPLRTMRGVVGDNFVGHVRRGSGDVSSGIDIVYRPAAGGKAASQDATGRAIAKADFEGTVRRVEGTSRGVVVEIDHGNHGLVAGKQLISIYRHLRNPTVKVGQEVSAGDSIGKVSFDPKDSEQRNHLHYEMRWGGHLIDPQPFFALANGNSGRTRRVTTEQLIGALNVGADKAKVAFAGPRATPKPDQAFPIPGRKPKPTGSGAMLLLGLFLLLASKR